MASKRFLPSVPNYNAPLLAATPFCIKDECLLSHKIVDMDRSNIGKLYELSPSRPTNIFTRICHNCLLTKLGLYESYNEESIGFLHCAVKDTYGDDSGVRKEGPFLKAFKPIPDLVVEDEVAFPKGTVILPSGAVLLDSLMSERESYFEFSNRIPQFNVMTAGRYGLNPYIYGYFHHIHDLQTSPSRSSSADFKKIEDYEDLLFDRSDAERRRECLSGIYEYEAFVLSNLINPMASLSNYVKMGTNFDLGKEKVLNVDLPVRQNVSNAKWNETELSSADEHVSLDVRTNASAGKTKLRPHQVSTFNSYLRLNAISMRQLIMNRKQDLRDYFLTNAKPVYSALGLHVLSFCVPSVIYLDRQRSAVSREYQPNVEYVEGLGLVATQDICKHELLISNQMTSYLDFTHLKMARYDEDMKYLDVSQVDSPADKLSYVYEGKREPNKQALYSKLL